MKKLTLAALVLIVCASASAQIGTFNPGQQVTATWTNATTIDTRLILPVWGYNGTIITFAPSGSLTGGSFIFEACNSNSPENSGVCNASSTWYAENASRDGTAGTIDTSYALNGASKAAWHADVAGWTHYAIRLNPAITGTGTAYVGVQGIASVTTGPRPILGSITTAPPTDATTNVTKFAGNAVLTGTGASGSGVPRVTVANDSTVTANAGTGTFTTQDVADVAPTTTTAPTLATVVMGKSADTPQKYLVIPLTLAGTAVSVQQAPGSQVQVLGLPPALPANVVNNPLLYAAAMQQYCSRNLCAPALLGK